MRISPFGVDHGAVSKRRSETVNGVRYETKRRPSLVAMDGTRRIFMPSIKGETRAYKGVKNIALVESQRTLGDRKSTTITGAVVDSRHRRQGIGSSASRANGRAMGGALKYSTYRTSAGNALSIKIGTGSSESLQGWSDRGAVRTMNDYWSRKRRDKK